MCPRTDEPLARLAAEQGGAVGRNQLLALGLSPRAISRRLAAGRLHDLHTGVYAVGHVAMTPKGGLMAAVLAGGPGAVASHRSAAWWHGLRGAAPGRHDVTTRSHRRSGRVGFHRTVLRDDDVTEHDGVPVTTVARTLLDLADVAPRRALERAIDQAEIRRLLHLPDLHALMARSNGRHGLGTLRRVLEEHAPGSTLTRSELEERALALIRAASLPLPQVNATVGPYVVDLLWPEHGLVVELDGAGVHDRPGAFVDDRRRDVVLQVAGLRVLRFTWRDVAEGETMIAALRAVLGGGVAHRRRSASSM